MKIGTATAVLVLLSAALAEATPNPAAWTTPFAPFRIIGNVYYVGTAGLASFLIVGPKGHVLIDGGLPEDAPLIATSIRQLGFRLRDVQYILINHSHYDHAGGLAELKRSSGAKLIASRGDAPDLEAGRTIGRPDIASFPPVKVDRIVGDGALLQLGPIRLVAHLTPGHTRGCTSWSLSVEGKSVLFACSLTVAGQRLVNDPTYPTAASDFRATFATLRRIEADVFLNFHPEFFDMQGKRTRQLAGDANAFIDRAELPRQIDRAERDFAKVLADQR